MTTAAVDFILSPDTSTVRQIKTIVADQAPGLNRTVGTWPELIAKTETTYLLPPVQDNWKEKLTTAASRQKDAFWSASLAVAPRETIVEIDTAITRLLKSKGPNPDWQNLISTVENDSRLNQRLSDLAELIQTIDRLPDSLQKMANLLACQDFPHPPHLCNYLEDSMDLDAWQMAVLDKINSGFAFHRIRNYSLSWQDHCLL